MKWEKARKNLEWRFWARQAFAMNWAWKLPLTWEEVGRLA